VTTVLRLCRNRNYVVTGSPALAGDDTHLKHLFLDRPLVHVAVSGPICLLKAGGSLKGRPGCTNFSQDAEILGPWVPRAAAGPS